MVLEAKARESAYYQELLLLKAYLSLLKGSVDDLDLSIKKALSVSPYQTRDFKKNIFISENIIYKSLWESWCQPLVKNVKKDEGLSQILQSYCDFKSGRKEQGIEGIEEVVKEYYDNTLGLSLYGFMLIESSGEKKALVELDRALEINPQNQLALSLKASICEKLKRRDCVLSVWSKLIEVKPDSLVAHAGLALYYLQNEKRELAMEYYQKGLAISSDYIPLLEVEEMLNEEPSKSH